MLVYFGKISDAYKGVTNETKKWKWELSSGYIESSVCGGVVFMEVVFGEVCCQFVLLRAS